jgi:hypothetical protein
MMRPLFFSALVVLALSCNNHPTSLQPNEFAAVQDSVLLMAESIAKNISHDGPVAWPRYFEDTPEFFMASEGQLVFPNYDSAKNFINHTLVKNIRAIELHWGNIRIDPITGTAADIAATFHEDITDAAGKTSPQDGYFTGLAHQTPQGWKLKNAHWSIKATH